MLIRSEIWVRESSGVCEVKHSRISNARSTVRTDSLNVVYASFTSYFQNAVYHTTRNPATWNTFPISFEWGLKDGELIQIVWTRIFQNFFLQWHARLCRCASILTTAHETDSQFICFGGNLLLQMVQLGIRIAIIQFSQQGFLWGVEGCSTITADGNAKKAWRAASRIGSISWLLTGSGE